MKWEEARKLMADGRMFTNAYIQAKERPEYPYRSFMTIKDGELFGTNGHDEPHSFETIHDDHIKEDWIEVIGSIEKQQTESDRGNDTLTFEGVVITNPSINDMPDVQGENANYLSYLLDDLVGKKVRVSIEVLE